MLHFQNLIAVQLYLGRMVRLVGPRVELLVRQSRRCSMVPILLLFLVLGYFPRLVIVKFLVRHGTGMKVFPELVKVILQVAFGQGLLGRNALAFLQPHVEDALVFGQFGGLNVTVGAKFFCFGILLFGFFVVLFVVMLVFFVAVLLVSTAATVGRRGGGITAVVLVPRVPVFVVLATLFVFLFVMLVATSFVSRESLLLLLRLRRLASPLVLFLVTVSSRAVVVAPSFPPPSTIVRRIR